MNHHKCIPWPSLVLLKETTDFSCASFSCIMMFSDLFLSIYVEILFLAVTVETLRISMMHRFSMIIAAHGLTDS